MGYYELPPDFLADYQELKNRIAQLSALATVTLLNWVPITYLAGFVDNPGYSPTAVAKDQTGQVRLRGSIKCAAGLAVATTQMGTIPAGLRPTESGTFFGASCTVYGTTGVPGVILIAPTGEFYVSILSAPGGVNHQIFWGNQSYR